MKNPDWCAGSGIERHALDAGLSAEETGQLLAALARSCPAEAMQLLRRHRATLLQSIHKTQEKLYCLDLLLRTISNKGDDLD